MRKPKNAPYDERNRTRTDGMKKKREMMRLKP
jgi:hypothetical protein